MKKLLTLALLTLSPLTFAKEFNPDLLVGKWQCEANYNYKDNDYHGTDNLNITISANGNYVFESHAKESIDGKNFNTATKYLGKWQLKDDIFTVEINNVLSYTNDHPEIEAIYQFGKNYEGTDGYIETKVLQLTKNTFISELSKSDQQEYIGNYLQICRR